MRTSRPLDALFPRTRQLILAATLLQPDGRWYLSDLARHLGLRELTPALRQAEQALGRPVNVTLFTPAEFASKREAGHHFVRTVLASPKLFLLGSAADLVPTPGRTPRANAPDKHAGTRRP